MYVKWTTHTIDLSVAMVKEVTCEKCRARYAYAIERTERGQGTTLYNLNHEGAQADAVANAQAKLQNSLQGAYELVPCPNCGTYQTEMVGFLKRAHLKWLHLLAGLLILGSAVVFVFAYLNREMMLAGIGGTGIVVAIGMIVYRGRCAAQYDPNGGDPAPRIHLGKSLALTKQGSSGAGGS